MPTEAVTDAQLRALLEARSTVVTCGVDLLDADLTYLQDISKEVLADEALTVSYEASRALPFTAALTTILDLQWGRQRVRPWVQIAAPAPDLFRRWNMGVFGLPYPARDLDTSPAVWRVEGLDQLLRVDQETGRTLEVVAGTDALAEVQRILTIELGETHHRFAPAINPTVLVDDMVWIVSDRPTWRQVCNEMLKSVGYGPLGTDRDGWFTSAPLRTPAQRPTVWRFNTTDPATSIVYPERTLDRALADIPNVWVFYARSSSRVFAPVEGDGIYRVENLSDGPTSINARGGGRLGVQARSYELDATDQESLVAQGDEIVAADKAAAGKLSQASALVPVLWADDVVEVVDAQIGGPGRWLVERWSADLTARSFEMTMDLRQVA